MSAAQLCDRAIAVVHERGRERAHPRVALAATILASSMGFVDGSVVYVGLPAIRHDLHADATDLQWVVNAYLLPLSALLLLGGALGDRYGQRRLLTLGVAMFAAGSAGCAVAPGLEWLIAAPAKVSPRIARLLGSGRRAQRRRRPSGHCWAVGLSTLSAGA